MTYVEADNRYESVVYLVPGQGNDPAALLASIYYSETQLQPDIDLILDEVDQVSSGCGFESVRPTLLSCGDEAPEAAPGIPQLATYTAGVVLNALLVRAGIRPDIIVPQSMGEIAGLVCAEVLDVAEGAHAVCALNIAFARHDGGGSMVVIRADAAEAERVLALAGRPDLVLAGANTARQSIISGSTESIDALMARASDPAIPTMLKLPVPYTAQHGSPPAFAYTDYSGNLATDVIVSQLKAAGFNVTTNIVNINDEFTFFLAGKYQSITGSMGDFLTPDLLPVRFFSSTGDLNKQGFSSPEFDADIKAAASATTPADAKADWLKADQVLSDQIPWVWTVTEPIGFILSSKVHGVDYSQPTRLRGVVPSFAHEWLSK